MPSLLAPSLFDAIEKQDCEPVAMKQCSKCKELLPLALFYKEVTGKDGLRASCKTCDAKCTRLWYDNGGKEQRRNYEKENPIIKKTSDMLCNARQRARNKNLPFDIDLDYVRALVGENAEFARRCPIFNVPLDYSTRRTEGKGEALPNSPSLDRIDPKLGYVKGNVWIISHRANTIKSDASHEELKLVTEAVGRAIVNSLDW